MDNTSHIETVADGRTLWASAPYIDHKTRQAEVQYSNYLGLTYAIKYDCDFETVLVDGERRIILSTSAG